MRIAIGVMVCLVALLVGLDGATKSGFQATPLVDFAAGQKYLGTFGGLLYTDPSSGADTNAVPAQHDVDGRSIAAQVVPLDANGKLSATGKIGVVAIGMSNWTDEICIDNPNDNGGACASYSFMGQAAASSQVNHTTLVLADCAQAGKTANTWIDDTLGDYTTCIADRLPLWKITAEQVEVVLWKDGNPDPETSLASATHCQSQALPIRSTNPDVCSYEQYLGMVARFLKIKFPNIKQMFVHSRTYGGYATFDINPEPYAYEYGFATKWFVSAQLAQIAKGTIDPVAGDLNYSNGTAPWIAWGPYWWAAGTTPCKNCEISGQVWLRTDFTAQDGTHPTPSGRLKIAQNLMNFYLNSPYSPWFRAH